jgi:hypothetical protein
VGDAPAPPVSVVRTHPCASAVNRSEAAQAAARAAAACPLALTLMVKTSVGANYMGGAPRIVILF